MVAFLRDESLGCAMFKMTFYLSLVMFLTMLIAGRDLSGTDQIANQAAAVEDPAADTLPEVVPAETALLAIDAASQIAPPAPAAPVLTQPAPILVRMPGPALRPSPEDATADPAPDGPQIWRVVTNRLNVRSGPSTGHDIVDRIARGDEALVLSDPDAEWVQIRIEGDGVEGWVARRLLAPVEN